MINDNSASAHNRPMPATGNKNDLSNGYCTLQNPDMKFSGYKYHRKDNPSICDSDTLAIRIKNDFPDYTLEASLIKDLNTLEKIEYALRTYDHAKLPGILDDNDRLPSGLKNKERSILFCNADNSCTFPRRGFHPAFSQQTPSSPTASSGTPNTFLRLDARGPWSNVEKLSQMGFSFFKLIPPGWPISKNSFTLHRRRKRFTVPSLPYNKSATWLCSFPKCGRTWLRFLIANYLKLNFDLPLEITFHSLFRLLPNEGDNHLKGIGGYQFTDDARFPLIISSHAPWRKGRFADAPVIFLLRSVPDVIVSYYFHTSRLLNSYSGTLKDFIRSPQGGLHRYLRYLNSWTEFIQSAKTPIHLVHYEDLHSRTSETIAGVLNFLGLPVKPSLLAEAIQLSSFEAMQRVEKKNGIAGHDYDFSDPEARRVRKGRVNGYCEYLDESDMIHIEKVCAEYSLSNEEILVRFQMQ